MERWQLEENSNTRGYEPMLSTVLPLCHPCLATSATPTDYTNEGASDNRPVTLNLYNDNHGTISFIEVGMLMGCFLNPNKKFILTSTNEGSILPALSLADKSLVEEVRRALSEFLVI